MEGPLLQYEEVRPLGQGAYARVVLCRKTDTPAGGDEELFVRVSPCDAGARGGARLCVSVWGSMARRRRLHRVPHAPGARRGLQAIKVIDRSKLEKRREYRRVGSRMTWGNAFQQVEREVAIMKKLQHPSLLRLFDVIDDEASGLTYIVLEFAEGGQVMQFDALRRRYSLTATTRAMALSCGATRGAAAPDAMPEAFARQLVRSFIPGLQYLHSNRVVHRDLKPENLLIVRGGACKLADFGVAHVFETGEEALVMRTEGTPQFFAPECLTGEAFDPFAVDMWALGVTLFACAFGALPFDGDQPADVYDAIKNKPCVCVR